MNRRRDPASKTDALLWKQLANPDKVNIPERATVLLNGVGIEQPKGAFDRLTAKYSASTEGKQEKTRSHNKKRGRHDDDSDSDSSEDDSDDETNTSGSDDSNEETDGSESESDDNEDDSDEDNESEDEVSSFKKHKSSKFNRPASMGVGGFMGTQHMAGPAGYVIPQPVQDPMAERVQRQFYMNELLSCQRQGYQLSISLDESTPTYVLKTEYDLIQENQAAVTGVQNLRAGLTLTMRGVEMANDKLNSPLPLTGWTDSTIEQNPTQFDRPLRRIYNMYLRNSFNHPIVELGMALAFSGAGYMMRNVQYRASPPDMHDMQSGGGTTPFASYPPFGVGPSPNVGPMGGSGAVPRTFGQGMTAGQQPTFSSPPQASAPRMPPTPPMQGPGQNQNRRSLRPPFTAAAGQQRPSGHQDQQRAPMSAGQGQPVIGNIPVT